MKKSSSPAQRVAKAAAHSSGKTAQLKEASSPSSGIDFTVQRKGKDEKQLKAKDAAQLKGKEKDKHKK